MKPEWKSLVTYPSGNTRDIIKEMLDTYELYKQQPKDFARQFVRSTEQETCKAIWEYVKRNITYVLDAPNEQLVKTPARTVADGYGDCKSYSILIRSILYCLGIPAKFRFVGFTKGQKFKHVYVVAHAGNGQTYVLDACMPAFNSQHPYAFKTDL